ncbi:MAG: phosphoribosylformylglycinamidine synthase subunit PurS [Thermoplasmata archaeon]|nr:phosphoribosylformylglycinamidine synthase subunit PurS [Thermoplasmata archaeon]
MYVAEVRVELKKGVADPEGKNTKKALDLLGFDKVVDVRTSTFFIIELDVNSAEEARAMAEEMSVKLLSNPVIHIPVINIREV